jgi:hypothetical protein
MNQIDNKMLGAYLQVLGTVFIEGGYETLETAAQALVVNIDVTAVQFKSRGCKRAHVTKGWLVQIGQSLGYLKRSPINSFSEMSEVVKQFQEGLITEGEMIGALQCSKEQIKTLIKHNSLPYDIKQKIELSDWDLAVGEIVEKAIAPLLGLDK